MSRFLIYGIIFSCNSISDISFIGMTKGKISTLKSSLIYKGNVAVDSEKRRLISEIEKKGRDSFTIRILEIVEGGGDTPPSLMAEKAKQRVDELVMKIKPPLNIKVPLGEADYAIVRGRREVRRLNMARARESLRHILKAKEENNSTEGSVSEGIFNDE